jgi:single-stranded DNA-binding protein
LPYLIEGTLSISLWKGRNEDYQIHFSIAADALEFINIDKRDSQSNNLDADNSVRDAEYASG